MSEAKMSHGTSFLVYALFFLTCMAWTSGTLHSDLNRLISDKQKNYSTYVRPIRNLSHPLNLTVAFDLKAIREFNEVSEEFSVIGTMFMAWNDFQMVWTPDDYGGVEDIVIQNDIFWTPVFVLTNAFGEYKKFGVDEYWPIRYIFTGDAVYYPGNVLTAICIPYLTHYPWDKQECSLEFQVWGHFEREIRLIPAEDHVYTYEYNEHGTWDLLGSRVFLKPDNVTISFTLELKRKPEFLVVNVILPIIFLSYLNILVFLMPTSMGERISYSITVLLAIAVFLTIIGDNMPRSSRSIPYLSFYLMAVLLISIGIVLMLTFSLRIFYHQADTDIPAFWAWLGRLSLCKSSQYRGQQNQDHERGQHQQNTINTIDIDTVPMHLYSNEGFSVDETALRNSSVRNVVTWIDVSITLDWIFFVTTFLAVTCSTVLFLAYAIN